jgi:hypothetical protein
MCDEKTSAEKHQQPGTWSIDVGPEGMSVFHRVDA